MALSKNIQLITNICKVRFALTGEMNPYSYGEKELERTPEFVNPFTWMDQYATPGRITYTLSSSDSDAGTIYTQSLSFFYPGLDQSSIRQLYQWQNQEFVVEIDPEGLPVIYMGSPEKGASLTWNFATNQDGTVIQFNLADIYPFFTPPDGLAPDPVPEACVQQWYEVHW